MSDGTSTEQEKVRAFFGELKALHFPELKSKPGREMRHEVIQALRIVRKLIIHHSKNLL